MIKTNKKMFGKKWNTRRKSGEIFPQKKKRIKKEKNKRKRRNKKMLVKLRKNGRTRKKVKTGKNER